MKYIVNLPSGTEITLGLPYGSTTFQHGQVVPESYVTKSFPQYFVALPENAVKTTTTKPVVDDIITKIKQSLTKEPTNEVKNETPKKKAGRPKKAGFSKG